MRVGVYMRLSQAHVIHPTGACPVSESGCQSQRRLAEAYGPRPVEGFAEILWRNGEPISNIRAASYGHTLRAAVGLTMLESDRPITKNYVASGEWLVEIGNEICPCNVSLAPFYDPKNTRIKV